MECIISHKTGWSCTKEVEETIKSYPYYEGGERKWRGKKVVKCGKVHEYPDGGDLQVKLGDVVEIIVRDDESGICKGYEGIVKIISYDVVHTEIEKEIDYKQTLRRIKNGKS